MPMPALLSSRHCRTCWRHKVIMNLPNVPLVLVAPGLLAAAQSSPTPHSRPGPQEEALRLMWNGQFAEAHSVVSVLVEDTKRIDSPPRYALKREADRIRSLTGYGSRDRHRIDILTLRGPYSIMLGDMHLAINPSEESELAVVSAQQFRR